jgi:hypothetical protein
MIPKPLGNSPSVPQSAFRLGTVPGPGVGLGQLPGTPKGRVVRAPSRKNAAPRGKRTGVSFSLFEFVPACSSVFPFVPACSGVAPRIETSGDDLVPARPAWNVVLVPRRASVFAHFHIRPLPVVVPVEVPAVVSSVRPAFAPRMRLDQTPMGRPGLL